jgi:hypothetical protein
MLNVDEAGATSGSTMNASGNGAPRSRGRPGSWRATCDGDEYSGFISAFGGVADMGGLAAGLPRSRMTPSGRFSFQSTGRHRLAVVRSTDSERQRLGLIE